MEDNNGAFIITDTTFSAEIDHSLNMDHKKDKLFTSKFDQQPVVEISYFDTINNAKKNKQLLKIKSEQIKTLQSKSIGFLNSMSLKNNKFIKNADMLDAFFMSYSVPGLLVTSEIYSLESIKQDKKITDFITYLNSSLGSKYTFD